MRTEQDSAVPTDWTTVALFSATYPAWSEASLRALILASEDRFSSQGHKIPSNGMDQYGVIARRGRKVLLSPSRFFAWIAAEQQKRRKAA